MSFSALTAVVRSSAVLLFGLIWIGLVAFLRLKKRQSHLYILFFTIFFVYLVTVLYYTEFQLQVLFLLNYLLPGHLILRGETAWESMNLVPLITLTLEDSGTSLLNILLLIPFGLGLPFIANLRMKSTVIVGAVLSIVLELGQLISGLLATTTFRTVDINDVIFNTVGVATGYILFVGIVRSCRHIPNNWKISANPIVRYIAERPQMV